jgi:hypothetical protein
MEISFSLEKEPTKPLGLQPSGSSHRGLLSTVWNIGYVVDVESCLLIVSVVLLPLIY